MGIYWSVLMFTYHGSFGIYYGEIVINLGWLSRIFWSNGQHSRFSFGKVLWSTYCMAYNGRYCSISNGKYCLVLLKGTLTCLTLFQRSDLRLTNFRKIWGYLLPKITVKSLIHRDFFVSYPHINPHIFSFYSPYSPFLLFKLIPTVHRSLLFSLKL